MIENFGCDFFSSGLGHDLLEAKVKNFFERKTSDGPRYDTYLLYYTGDVYDTGDWALAGSHMIVFRLYLYILEKISALISCLITQADCHCSLMTLI